MNKNLTIIAVAIGAMLVSTFLLAQNNAAQLDERRQKLEEARQAYEQAQEEYREAQLEYYEQEAARLNAERKKKVKEVVIELDFAAQSLREIGAEIVEQVKAQLSDEELQILSDSISSKAEKIRYKMGEAIESLGKKSITVEINYDNSSSDDGVEL